MKPILFNTEMVRALLAGRKSVTRRVVKQCHVDKFVIAKNGELLGSFDGLVPYPTVDDCPYQPGDLLYVRETWQYGFGGAYLYKADAGYDLFMTPEGELVSDIPWRPSIHMPREAARLFLRVSEVYPQQLKDVTEADAEAEGFDSRSEFLSAILKMYPDITEENWVWEIKFEKISREEAQGWIRGI